MPQPATLSPAPRAPTGRRLPGRMVLAALPLALLAACASKPLPPWTGATPATVAPAPATAERPVRRPPAVVDMVPAPVVVTPIAPLGVEPAAPPAGAAAPGPSSEMAPAPGSPPYSTAVAARFPDPAVRYATPGLAEGRAEFSSNAEVHAWLQDLAAAGAGAVRAGLVPIGHSQAGEQLEALVITQSANTEPTTLVADGRPTVLLVGGQHGDEPASAEALLVVAREATKGLLAPLLARINIIVVPRANPDGAAAATRLTAAGIDMNRDHLLLRTPEARALAQLERNYRPMVVVDAHEYAPAGRFLEKFNAIERADGLLQYATTPNVPPFVTKAAEEWFRRPLAAALDRQALSSDWYHTTTADTGDLRVSMGGVLPDNGRNVDGLKNAVSLLVASRGAGLGRLHIQRRVHTQVTAATSVLQSTAARADDLKQLRSFVDRDVSALACREDAVIEAAPTAGRHALRVLDPVTGADRSIDVDWNSSLQLRTLKTRRRPCGYWLDASAGTAVDRLRAEGVQVLRLAESGSILMDSYRETSRAEGARNDVRGAIADGSSGDAVKVEVSLNRSLVDVPQGSYYVPLGQPLGNLVTAALEPDTQSSFFANHLIERLDAMGRVANVPSLRFEELAP